MSKIKYGGLDQYGTEPFEQQQFGTAGTEGVNFTLLAKSQPFNLTVNNHRPLGDSVSVSVRME